MARAVIAATPLTAGPWPTPDPFLFCVYHKDSYPAGNERMEAPRRGNGADFNPSAPYRMYHGERVPGFPKHPHRGFETVTATIEGLVDHADSLDNGGRYGDGDLQWMTAGRGIQHSEMFPLLSGDKPNPLRFFQIWLNLPQSNKMAEPTYVMHWAHEIPRVCPAEGVEVTVWAGRWGDAKGLPPPKDSYGAREDSDVAVQLLTFRPGAGITLPPAAGGAGTNRCLYLSEGQRVTIDGKEVSGRQRVELRGELPVPIVNTGSDTAEVLLLQGRPLKEPVAQHGPFVMNTQQEIRQAFMDYQRTSFGGWPYDRDDPVYPRGKGRFAKLGGKEVNPPPPPRRSA